MSLRDRVFKTAILVGLLGFSTGAWAQEWQSSSGRNPQGLESASMWVQKHEFAMELYCNEHNQDDNKLDVKFIGPAVPHLYGEDGDTAKLSLLFKLRDGVPYRVAWDAYYFDGGLGDQAWLGSINAGESELNALARALKLDIVNQDSELVYSFGAKGTAAAVAVIRETCGFAATPKAAESKVKADGGSEVARADGPDCHEWTLHTTFVTGGKTCVSSNLAPNDSATYGAGNLSGDGAWCANHKTGQFPAATLSCFGYGENGRPPSTSRLMVENGDTANAVAAGRTSRAKTVIVSSGNSYQEAYVLQDTAELQYIDLGYEIVPDEIQVEIIETYGGSNSRSVCISTLGADFEYDPAFKSDHEILARSLDLRVAYELKAKGSESVPQVSSEVPKPTDHIAYEDEPKPLTIEQFKVHAGWPEAIANYKISTPETMKFAIIDMGFAGAEEFITNTPALHGRVRYYRLGKETKKTNTTGSHGTNVLKVVNEVMPAGQIYLIDVSNAKGSAPDLGIKKMNELGVHYGTMSLGVVGRYGRHNLNEKTPEFVRLLEDTQTTLFVSAGNYRQTIHLADYSDQDQDGVLELWPNTADVADHEALWFQTAEDFNGLLTVSWDVPKNPAGHVTISVTSGDDEIEKRYSVRKGIGGVRFTAAKRPKSRVQVSVDGLEEPFGGIRIKKNLMYPEGPAWNGLRSSGDFAIWDSPFLIPVGSVGELDGRLAPSVFSSIDRSNQGKTMPLVLGPGQVKIGEDTFEGTSFATPFLAALYAAYGANNISNVIEETSGFTAIGEGYVPGELGRWGVPIAEKLLGSNRCFAVKNQLNQMQIEGSELSIEYQFSRNCMEKIRYAVVMTLETHGADPRTGYRGTVTSTIDGVEQPLQALQRDTSEHRDIVDKKMTFDLDLSNVSPRFKGLKVQPKFQIYTHMDRSGLVMFYSEKTVTLD